MRIVARRTLREFWERHPQAEGPLKAWFGRVQKADWRTPADIKASFGSSVDFVADNRVIFDIAGNKYRLVVHLIYDHGRVLIKFVDTHAQYDRIDPETV
jgi:mRNA interferase HigB